MQDTQFANFWVNLENYRKNGGQFDLKYKMVVHMPMFAHFLPHSLKKKSIFKYRENFPPPGSAIALASEISNQKMHVKV